MTGNTKEGLHPAPCLTVKSPGLGASTLKMRDGPEAISLSLPAPGELRRDANSNSRWRRAISAFLAPGSGEGTAFTLTTNGSTLPSRRRSRAFSASIANINTSKTRRKERALTNSHSFGCCRSMTSMRPRQSKYSVNAKNKATPARAMTDKRLSSQPNRTPLPYARSVDLCASRCHNPFERENGNKPATSFLSKRPDYESGLYCLAVCY